MKEIEETDHLKKVFEHSATNSIRLTATVWRDDSRRARIIRYGRSQRLVRLAMPSLLYVTYRVQERLVPTIGVAGLRLDDSVGFLGLSHTSPTSSCLPHPDQHAESTMSPIDFFWNTSFPYENDYIPRWELLTRTEPRSAPWSASAIVNTHSLSITSFCDHVRSEVTCGPR